MEPQLHKVSICRVEVFVWKDERDMRKESKGAGGVGKGECERGRS